MAPPQWAYQVENFVNEPDEELVCSICRAVFCDPVMCPCDHVFCQGCINKWIQNNRNCPICRKRVSHSSIKQMVPIIKNLIMKLMLNCHNKTLGCKAQFSLENSEAHVKECEYELVQCKNKPCKDRLFRKDVMEHETSDCPHRYIKCKTCGSKITTITLSDKHDCIRALQLRLRRKANIIRKKKEEIIELRNENKALKAASQHSSQPRTSSTSRGFGRDLGSSLSPDEIMINLAEFDSMSSSLSSDSDDTSENSIIIFTNDPLDNSDDNAESESFSNLINIQGDVEYSRNESPHDASEYRNAGPHDASEYRNAESQTLDDFPINDQQNDSQYSENVNSSFGNNIAVQASASGFGETEERSQPRRPMKRRPTTQKPAKRRFRPVSFSSSDDDDESKQQSSSQSSKRCWRLSSTDTDRGASENNQGDNSNSNMEAGPSSSAVFVAESIHDMSSNNKWHIRSKSDQNQAKHVVKSSGENADMNSKTVPLRNAVFERTLALLEQYNLESDPEWLPEYASHRGNDTTTDSDSSFETEFVDGSSSSELFHSDSNNEEENSSENPVVPGRNSAPVSDLMHWMLRSTSEDDDEDEDEDPDWHPINFLQNNHA